MCDQTVNENALINLILVCKISSRVDRVSATETVDLGSVPGTG